MSARPTGREPSTFKRIWAFDVLARESLRIGFEEADIEIWSRLFYERLTLIGFVRLSSHMTPDREILQTSLGDFSSRLGATSLPLGVLRFSR